ncbi:hypothetical protein VP01_6759g1 [Puccinia sorghi]|uniref:Uncharacterized protein n=1 Tax=Puccinia sorghi TaxID=27349 RepID=A0A0L6UEM2_9BASI|nr:hypothetical protein VP01_6759g1 [Puccinia sorghi]
MENSRSAIQHEVSRFSKRIFVWTVKRKCREHGNHSELAIVVPLDYTRKSTLFRIAENRRRYYLSTSVIDLWEMFGEDSPTFGGRPTWLGKLEDNARDHERLHFLVERIKEALKTVVESPLGKAGRRCIRDWVVTFIKQEEARGEFCWGRVRCVKETVDRFS